MNQLSLLIYVYSKFGTDGRGLDESTKQSKACVGSDRAVEDYSARLQGKSNWVKQEQEQVVLWLVQGMEEWAQDEFQR